MTRPEIESGRPYRQIDLATGEKQTVSSGSIRSQIETRQRNGKREDGISYDREGEINYNSI